MVLLLCCGPELAQECVVRAGAVPMLAACWCLCSGLCAGAGGTRSPETWCSSRLSGPLPALAPLRANGLSHREYKCVIPALELLAAVPTAGRHCPSLARLPVPVQGAAGSCLPQPVAGGCCPRRAAPAVGIKCCPTPGLAGGSCGAAVRSVPSEAAWGAGGEQGLRPPTMGLGSCWELGSRPSCASSPSCSRGNLAMQAPWPSCPAVLLVLQLSSGSSKEGRQHSGGGTALVASMQLPAGPGCDIWLELQGHQDCVALSLQLILLGHKFHLLKHLIN